MKGSGLQKGECLTSKMLPIDNSPGFCTFFSQIEFNLIRDSNIGRTWSVCIRCLTRMNPFDVSSVLLMLTMSRRRLWNLAAAARLQIFLLHLRYQQQPSDLEDVLNQWVHGGHVVRKMFFSCPA